MKIHGNRVITIRRVATIEREMANTYSQIYFHLVFSTKNRADLIAQEIEQRIWAYIAGVAKRHGVSPIQIGGIENHIHGLLGVPTILSASQVARAVKGDSSYGIRREFPGMEDFGWQDGYGVFSVSQSAIPDVVLYIKDQREHHAKQTFEDEYEALLKLHGIDFDPRFLFD